MHLLDSNQSGLTTEADNQVKIFYINLDRALERRELMEKQFAELGLEHERLAATDKNSLSASDYAQYSKFQSALSSARQLSDGEIACALSHYRIWNKILDEDLEMALIFEDDIIIDERIIIFIEAIDQIQSKFECINLKTDRRPNKMVEQIRELGALTNFHKKPNRACSYLLTKKGAKRLRKYAYPIRMPLDDLLGRFEMTKIPIFGLYPQIVELQPERSEASTIWGEGRMPKKSRLLRKIRSFLRIFTQWF